MVMSGPGHKTTITNPAATGTPAESSWPGSPAARARGRRVPVTPSALPRGGTEADDLRLEHADLVDMTGAAIFAEGVRVTLALAVATSRQRPRQTVWRGGHPMTAVAWLTERLAAVHTEMRRRS
jgi:hypothetical protein